MPFRRVFHGPFLHLPGFRRSFNSYIFVTKGTDLSKSDKRVKVQDVNDKACSWGGYVEWGWTLFLVGIQGFAQRMGAMGNAQRMSKLHNRGDKLDGKVRDKGFGVAVCHESAEIVTGRVTGGDS